MSRGRPRIPRWTGTSEEAAARETELRAQGLVPMQPLRRRVELLKNVGLWPCVTGPVPTSGSVSQQHLWLPPEVATIMYGEPYAERVLRFGLGRPYEERQPRFRAAAVVLRLGGELVAEEWAT